MWTAANTYGIASQGATYGVAAPTQEMGSNTIEGTLRGLLDPQNPLLWFGVILAATVGAIGVAGSVKLGPAKLSASLGKS